MGSWQIAYLEIGGTVQERMAVGLQVTAVGMTVCFIVLTLLYAIFLFVGRLGQAPSGGPGSKKDRSGSAVGPDLSAGEQPTSDSVSIQAAAAEPAPSMPRSDQPSRLAVVAAMVAALAAATEGVGLRPAKSIARPAPARAGSNWALAGRVQLMEGRTVPARHRA